MNIFADSVLICLSSWAIASWAPFAYVGAEINKLSSSGHAYGPVRRSSIELQSPLGLHFDHSLEDGNNNQAGGSSGKYLGIMNLYTTLPQFMSTGISWIVFTILEPVKSSELPDEHSEGHGPTGGPKAIGVCLFIGACSACLAALATRRFKRMQR